MKMKKYFQFGIASIALLLTSCSGPENAFLSRFPDLNSESTSVMQDGVIYAIDGATLDNEAMTAFMLVDPGTKTVSLSDKVKVSSNTTWKLYRGSVEISSKIAANAGGSLSDGNNFFRIVVSSAGIETSYSLTIHRCYYATIKYMLGEKLLGSEAIFTGHEFQLPETYNITGHSFSYWTDSDGNKITSITAYKNVVVYAHAPGKTYMVNLDPAGGELSENSLTVTYDESYSLPAPTRLGYDFLGWYDGKNNIPASGFWALDGSEEINLAAKWSAITYTIAYELNGGLNSTLNPKSYTIEDAFAFRSPTKTGYTFLGWYDEQGNAVTAIEAGSTGDLNLLARWNDGNAYVVTLNPNGGEVSSSTIDVQYDHTYTLPTPTRPGYDFLGWYAGSTSIATSGTWRYSSGMSVSAHWSIITYSISYQLNGGTNSSLNPASYTVQSNITLRSPSKTGYTFQGWHDQQGNQVTSISTGTTGNLTLTAHWNDGNDYVVSLNASGGEVSSSILNVQYDHAYALPMPTKTGYEFLGWYSGSTKISNSGTWRYTSGKSLTAHWSIITYSISYVLNGGSNDSSNPISYTVEDSITLADPVKEGYTFDGWYDLDGYRVDSIPSVNVGDLTLTAHWELAHYSINYHLGGGTNSESNPSSYTINDNITLSNPTRDGYEFSGWSDSEGNLVSSISEGSSGNVDFYANWASECLSFESVDGGVAVKLKAGAECPESIEIPSYYNDERVVAIGYAAFRDCTSLVSVSIPSTVTSIGNSAFSWCTSLSSITIPSSVASVGSDAFYYCTSLSSITIPSSVTAIGSWAFDHCTSLKSIEVDADNPVYDSREGCNAIIRTSDDCLVVGCSSTVIPSSVASVGSSAFYGCASLESIIIPNSVTSIGNDAFAWCASLESIIIPNSVTSLGSDSFRGCSSMKSITIPSSITSIGYETFRGCSSMETITIPSSITSIGNYAFQGCTSLSSVDIPSSVTSINDGAFEGCAALASLSIPSSVTSIGRYAFSNCTSLSSLIISYGIENIDEYTFDGCTSLTSVSFPDSVTTIRYNAFQGCTSLESIFIPSSVTSIGGQAFSCCPSLSSIEVDPGNPVFDSRDGCNAIINSYFSHYYGVRLILGCSATVIPSSVTAIGSSAFYGCTSLESIAIPSSVTSIESNAFYGCTSLESIDIPSSVTSIGYWAFANCTSLESIAIPSSVASISEHGGFFYGCTSLISIEVDADNPVYDSREGCNAIIRTSDDCLVVGCSSTVIPSSVTSIGSNAFHGCTSLESIDIPSSVTSIGTSAFNGCASLASIDIPSSVTSIGYWAFANCTSLSSVAIPSSVTGIESSAFENCTSLSSVAIPSSVTSIGGSAFHGCASLESIAIPSSVTYIGSSAFQGCASLESIAIPSSVTSIGYWAFANCTSLESIAIPSSVASIGDGAFESCASLSSVNIPSSVTSIGSQAFYGCASLESIAIPSSVASIGSLAFSWCTSLESIDIPSSVTSIGSQAFYGCASLESIAIPSSVTSIGSLAFDSCPSLSSIYYGGTSVTWDDINLSSKKIPAWTTVYFYSDEEPTEVGNYWHYVDGVPTVW